jgi:hypothetical protein
VDDEDARLVVTFAVPLMLEDDEMGQAEETVSRASRLQRPA